ncbi:hypothetical protein Mpsy_0322 [Methanolobus psychrophilus R15]|nr:hypothetical protein Mpsy_0322 [Methanolobus psychrophilus R15]
MTAQCDYIEETNPYFVQGQVTIEKEKIRRALGMDGWKSLMMPMLVIAGIVLIVWLIFGGGGGGGQGVSEVIMK